eukprot:scaffold7283_cov124-Isochrysis_galbana.AAC.1
MGNPNTVRTRQALKRDAHLAASHLLAARTFRPAPPAPLRAIRVAARSRPPPPLQRVSPTRQRAGRYPCQRWALPPSVGLPGVRGPRDRSSPPSRGTKCLPAGTRDTPRGKPGGRVTAPAHAPGEPGLLGQGAVPVPRLAQRQLLPRAGPKVVGRAGGAVAAAPRPGVPPVRLAHIDSADSGVAGDGGVRSVGAEAAIRVGRASMPALVSTIHTNVAPGVCSGSTGRRRVSQGGAGMGRRDKAARSHPE